MRKLLTLFLIALIFSFAAQAQFTVLQTAKVPTIDGKTDGDSWGTTWINLAQAKPGNTTTAMSSKFQISHDADNIYIIVQTQDATPSNDPAFMPNSYDRDCSEMFFSMHSVTLDDAYAKGDWQIRCQRASATGEFIDGTVNVTAALAAGKIKYAVFADGVSQYTQEFAFSKTTLADTSDFDGINFRFDMQAADNTTGAANGRTQQQFWNNNSDSQWNNINLLGAMVLGGISQTYPVNFTITDKNLIPVEGATIALTGYNPITSNTAGKATFSWVIPANDIAYTITKAGFKVATGTISVINMAVNINVSLAISPLPVNFTVTDENLFPIEGATIELTGYTAQKTNSTGKATFAEVNPANNIAYTITKTSFKTLTGAISVTNATVYENTVMSLNAFPVTFTLTDENISPVEGATIELTGYDTQITNSTGKAMFENVFPEGDIAYSVTKTGFRVVTGTVSVVDADVYENIEMNVNTSISDFNGGASLKVYPNPVSKTLSISSIQNIESLAIINLQGQVVYKFNASLSKNKELQINVSELPCGVYFIKADTEIVRLIVE